MRILPKIGAALSFLFGGPIGNRALSSTLHRRRRQCLGGAILP